MVSELSSEIERFVGALSISADTRVALASCAIRFALLRDIEALRKEVLNLITNDETASSEAYKQFLDLFAPCTSLKTIG